MAHSQADLQLILLSAGTAARRQTMREQAKRVMAEVDWYQLAEALYLRKLLPALGPRILELAEGSASDGFATAVERALETGRRQGVFLQSISLRVMAILADAGIRSAPLKGPFLSEAIYGDPGRRLSSDIDLLVAPDQLEEAVEVVRGLGYGAPNDPKEQGGLPQLHFALAHERGEWPPIELHWRIHWYERRFALERLLPPTVGQPDGWRPAPSDELVALLLFYARDGFIDLRLATDLSAWWDVFGAELQPTALDGLLRDYPEFARVVLAAATVAERVVGLPASQVIGDIPKLGARDHMAVRLANPNPHTSQSQLYADRGLIDGLLAPPGGFGAFVRRQILPPREVLDDQARHAHRQRARSSLGRGVGMLARYGRAMIRLLLPQTLREAHHTTVGTTPEPRSSRTS